MRKKELHLTSASSIVYLSAILGLALSPCPAAIASSGLNAEPDVAAAVIDEPALFADGFEQSAVEISLEDRWAAMEAAREYFDGLAELSLQEKNEAMRDWLLDHPLIKDAGIDTEVVWAYFLDGLPIMLADNRRTKSSQAPQQAPQQAPVQREYPGHFSVTESSVTAGSPALQIAEPQPYWFDAEQPSSQNVLFINAFEGGWGSNLFTPFIQQRLEEVGYNLGSVSTDPDPTMANFKAQVQDLGLFYIAGHSGRGWFEEIIPEGAVVGPYFAFQSHIELTQQGYDALIETDVITKRLVPMIISVESDENGNDFPAVYRWGITERFVAHYFSFSQNSIAFVDGCNTDNSRLKFALTDSGADTVLSWKGSVEDNEAAAVENLLFRRLLGSDRIVEDSSLGNKCIDASTAFDLVEDSSPVRPFDLDSVWEELKRRGRTEDCNGTQLTLHRSEDSRFGVLVPSLRSVQVFPADGTLHLYGLFGADPGEAGQVFLAETPRTILSWSQWEIIIELPDEAHGDVYVTKNGIQGNAVALSRFTGMGSMDLVSPVSGLFATANFTLDFRGDFSPFRVKPDDEPVYWASPEFSAYNSDPEFPKFAGRYVELTSGGGNNALLGGISEISYNYFGSLANSGCEQTGTISGGGSLPVLLMNPVPVVPPAGDGFGGTMSLSLLDPPGVPQYLMGLNTAGADGTYSNPGCPEADGAVVDLINVGLSALGMKAAQGDMGTVEGGLFVSDEVSPFGFTLTSSLTLPTMNAQPAHDPDLYPD